MPEHRTAAVLRGPVSALAAALVALAVAVAFVALSSRPASGTAARAAGAAVPDPVIIIPGMTGDTSYMSTMRTNFVNAGWPADRAVTWTDSTKMTGDLTRAGQEIGQKVDQVLSRTGARKVILVTWSASTLAARSYLKHVPGAQAKVSHYFSMAGPHHGTTTASACQNTYTSCRQFAVGSAWLRDLNAGTEVPGSPAVRYTTLRSTCDTNVSPSVSAELAGADNRLAPTCVNHFQFPTDTGVFNLIRQIIGSGGGTPGPTPTSTAPPPYSEKVSATAVDHYLAGRVDVNGYLTLGARYGYVEAFPLYRCAAAWTDKPDCSPL
ncbi:esterase/lipase family protein [Bailinhaonella thermotolerans]|uniref:Lipase n=1 Tax=Bailinhaonella thermotolerans TaxID=1070861 RepID=A0A3A4B458_9ACTN|nr:lipase [Bailinhaonella thermotolerans]RJL35951.1 lipase [Bailinhaonella thermotolerans]